MIIDTIYREVKLLNIESRLNTKCRNLNPLNNFIGVTNNFIGVGAVGGLTAEGLM